MPYRDIFALEEEEDSLRKKKGIRESVGRRWVFYFQTRSFTIALQYVAGGSEEKRNSVSRAVNLFYFLAILPRKEKAR